MQNFYNNAEKHFDIKHQTILQHKNVYRNYRIRLINNANSKLRLLTSGIKTTSSKNRERFKAGNNSKIPHYKHTGSFDSANQFFNIKPRESDNAILIQGMIWEEPIYKFVSPGGILW